MPYLSMHRVDTEPQGVQDGVVWEGELHGTSVGDKWWLPFSAGHGLGQQWDRIHANSDWRVSLEITGFWCVNTEVNLLLKYAWTCCIAQRSLHTLTDTYTSLWGHSLTKNTWLYCNLINYNVNFFVINCVSEIYFSGLSSWLTYTVVNSIFICQLNTKGDAHVL